MSDVDIIPFLRTGFNYDRRRVSLDSGLVCLEPTMAQQQFKDDSDPNVIMDLFTRTGDLSLLEVTQPSYGVFTSSVRSFQDAQNQVIAGSTAFNTLPAGLRTRFDNDPAKFVDFVLDPKNRDEVFELGMLKPDAKASNSPLGEGLDVAPTHKAGKAKPSPKPPQGGDDDSD